MNIEHAMTIPANTNFLFMEMKIDLPACHSCRSFLTCEGQLKTSAPNWVYKQNSSRSYPHPTQPELTEAPSSVGVMSKAVVSDA